MPTGAQLIVDLLERRGRRGRLRPPRRPQPRALGGAARILDPARRRPPRAGRRLRGRRLRARDRQARRRADHHRPRRGQHARRGRRGVGVALADPRDRHRHPGRAAPPGRLPRRAARDDRPGGDVRARGEGDATGLATERRRHAQRAAIASATSRAHAARLPRGADRPAVRRGARPATPGRRRPPRSDSARARSALIDAAERPLIWAGSRRDRAATACGGSPSGSPRRSSRPTARPACCRPATRAGRDAAARRGRRPAVGRRGPRDLGRLGPRRRPDPELRPAAAADAARDQPRRGRRDQELPRRRRARRGDARAGMRGARGARARARRPSTRSPTACTACARSLRRRSTRGRCASSTRSASPSPTTGSWSRTCASRATGWPGSTRPRTRASCRSRSAGARSATRSRRRSARRSRTAGRSSRSPATAASSTRRGELATVAQERIPLTLVIVDDGGYGMLRYDQDVSGADRYGVDLVTPDFCALAPRVRHPRPARRRARATTSAPRWPSTCSIPSRACSSPRRPSRSSRRPNTSPNWYRRKQRA